MPIVTEDLHEQILSAIRKGNDLTIEKIRAAAGAVPAMRTRAAKIRAVKIPDTKFSASKLRTDAVAYAGKLPAPADVVESAFGLADRLMAERRKLVGEVRNEVRKATAALRPAASEPKTAASEPKTADEPKPEPSAEPAGQDGQAD